MKQISKSKTKKISILCTFKHGQRGSQKCVQNKQNIPGTFVVNKRVNIHVLHPCAPGHTSSCRVSAPQETANREQGGGEGRGLMQQSKKRAFQKLEELNRCKESLEGQEVVRKAWTTWKKAQEAIVKHIIKFSGRKILTVDARI